MDNDDAVPPPACCSSHLFQMESFFSGTMMIGPVAPMIRVGAGSSRLPLFHIASRVAKFGQYKSETSR